MNDGDKRTVAKALGSFSSICPFSRLSDLPFDIDKKKLVKPVAGKSGLFPDWPTNEKTADEFCRIIIDTFAPVDLCAALYTNGLGNIPFEKIARTLGSSLLAAFSGGAVRLYNRDDVGRLCYNMAYIRSILRHTGALKGKRLLEVGCSDGLTCDLLLSEGASEVVGIDTLDTVGSRYPNPLITYKQMDGANLAFKNDTFDVSYSIATLEHCPDPLAVIREMLRVTKKGDICYIQAGPLYFSPFGHHMFDYFDDMPWIHLRMSPDSIVQYCHKKNLTKRIAAEKNMPVESYVNGMLSKSHVNKLRLDEYGIDRLKNNPSVKVVSFNISYEGKDFFSNHLLEELSPHRREDLVQHGFELVLTRQMSTTSVNASEKL